MTTAPARRRPEEGLTLVEALVTMLILSVVLSFTFATVLALQRVTRTEDLRAQALTEMRRGIGLLARDLRTATRPDPTATPFIEADGQHVRFYADRGNADPTIIDLRLEVGELIQVTWTLADGPATGPIPVGASQRVIARDVVNGADPADVRIFVFRDGAAPPNELNPADGSAVVTTDLSKIESVRMQVTARPGAAATGPSASVSTTVRLPNVLINTLDED